MDPQEMLTPEQIVSYNEAFAKSLVQLTDASQHQLNGIVDTALRIAHAVAALSSQQSAGGTPEDPAETLKTLFRPLSASQSASQAASQAADSNSADNADTDGPAGQFDPWANNLQAIVQALANAHHNATTAQQQANVTAQAATTLGITTLFNAVAKFYGLPSVINPLPTDSGGQISSTAQPAAAGSN